MVNTRSKGKKRENDSAAAVQVEAIPSVCSAPSAHEAVIVSDEPVQETNQIINQECEKDQDMKEAGDDKGKENAPEQLEEIVPKNEESKQAVEKSEANKALNVKQNKKAQKVESTALRPLESKIKPIPCGAEVMKSIPRGRPKSGRLWKDPKSNPRYMYKDKGLKMPFEKITQLRLERKRVKELENRMKEEERLRREDLKRRREVNKIRQEENAKKGEIVQVIRNTGKLKRMSKKQLRLIQKRDTAVVS